MSKREAVPKHSLPPQKQILSYMGRFINCPYAPDTDVRGFWIIRWCRWVLPLYAQEQQVLRAFLL